MENIHETLKKMNVSIPQFRLRVARLINPTFHAEDGVEGIGAAEYRSQIGRQWTSQKIERLAAAELRAIADYRAAGLSAAEGREVLAKIAETLSRRSHHIKSTDYDGLNNAEYRRQQRQNTVDLRRAEIVRAMIPTWCGVINVRWVEAELEQGMGYHQEAEWDRSYKHGSHRWPSRRYDVMSVTILRRTMPEKLADGSIRLGRIAWKKLRGHSLAVRYVGDAVHAAADFAATTNHEIRRAIIAAHGEEVAVGMPTGAGVGNRELVQQDDFGQLWDVIGTGRFVRVVCPTTGAAYWLGVQPKCKTAHEAVAESFGLRVENYSPTLQA